jgi:Flp pilus assembly pilin Flp
LATWAWETNVRLFQRFLPEESAATAIEYAMIAALVSVMIVVVTAIGTALSAKFYGPLASNLL